jgi:hypothetical protein
VSVVGGTAYHPDHIPWWRWSRCSDGASRTEIAPVDPPTRSGDVTGMDKSRRFQLAVASLVIPPVLAIVAVATAAPPPKGWYCTRTSKGDFFSSGCQQTRIGCKERNRRFIEGGFRVTACRFQPRAAVFTFTNELEGRGMFVGYMTFRDCRDGRESFLTEPDDYSEISECFAADIAPGE